MNAEVVFSKQRKLGLITLNRPKALNALTLKMIQAIQHQLMIWEEDEDTHAVIVQSSSDNAFCAGGDVRWLYQTGKADYAGCMQFFWHEYRMNHYIGTMKTPFIALMDGMTMGGGVGLAMHGSHPVATERYVFAMPETGIGFFPDIGASHLLTGISNPLGMYLGLTGNRLSSFDAYDAGLVKKVVASADLADLVKTLDAMDLSDNAHEAVDACIQQYALSKPEDYISAINPLIDTCFNADSIEAIINKLENNPDPWAEKMLKICKQKAPLSLKITHTQLQKARGLSLAECLAMDYVLVGHFMRGSDFYEGVRALLVDKDKNPSWSPARISSVDERQVCDYFEQDEKGIEFN